MMRKLLIAAAASVALLLGACDSAVLIAPDDGSTQTGSGPTGEFDLVTTAENAGNFNTLLTALEAAGLRDTLADANNVNTVFAPTDDAFALLGDDVLTALLADSDALTDTLLYHVLAGNNNAAAATALAGTSVTMLNGKDAALTLELDQLKINGATVTATDIAASNGTIHVIDAVLTPPADNPAPTESIAGLVNNDPQFSTLLDALVAADLDSTLAGDGTFTVFAPTNDAFDAVGEEMLNALLADPDALRDVLLYHVVDGSAIDSVAATAAAGTSLTSAAGQTLAVSLDGENLKINDATVIQADIAATNGIVHAIDTVLIPPAAPAPGTIVDVLSNNPDYSSLVSLVTTANLVDALNDVDANFTVFAPNNAALAAADAALAAGFTSDPAALANLLLGHVHGAVLTSADVIALDGTNLAMESGSQPIAITAGVLSIGGAEIVDADLQAQNGVIHGIDAVLLP